MLRFSEVSLELVLYFFNIWGWIVILLIRERFAWKNESFFDCGLAIFGTFFSTQVNIRYSNSKQQKAIPFWEQHFGENSSMMSISEEEKRQRLSVMLPFSVSGCLSYSSSMGVLWFVDTFSQSSKKEVDYKGERWWFWWWLVCFYTRGELL